MEALVQQSRWVAAVGLLLMVKGATTRGTTSEDNGMQAGDILSTAGTTAARVLKGSTEGPEPFSGVHPLLHHRQQGPVVPGSERHQRESAITAEKKVTWREHALNQESKKGKETKRGKKSKKSEKVI